MASPAPPPFNGWALPVPIFHPAPGAVFVIVKLLLFASNSTSTRSAGFEDCVTLPDLGRLSAARAAARAV